MLMASAPLILLVLALSAKGPHLGLMLPFSIT